MQNEFENNERDNMRRHYRDHAYHQWWDDPEFQKRRRRGRVMGGLILIAAGALWLAHAMGAMIPLWLFTWPMFLIVLGLFLLAKNGFQRPGGLILITIGAVFMIEQTVPDIHIRHIIWPILIILAGAFMIFNPWRKWKQRRWEQWKNNVHLGDDGSSGDFLNINAIFGGVEKTVISKNFKGGEVHCVFGGAEINLMQADIQGTVILEVDTVFGGMEVIVPSNWKVKSEITAVLGGVSDKRPVNPDGGDENKTLILKGNAVFGGVEVKSY